jgi:hypothetical protein
MNKLSPTTLKKVIFSFLFLTLISLKSHSQDFKDGILKIANVEFKEGTEFKIGTSSSNVFKYIVQGTTRMITAQAPTFAWTNAPVRVIGINMKKNKYELKLKVTNFEGMNKIITMNSLWVTDIEAAINTKEIVINNL